MRALTTAGVLLALAAGVGRGSPPSAPASPAGPATAPSPIPPLAPIPPADVRWSKSERAEAASDKGDTKKLAEEVEKLRHEGVEAKPTKADPADVRKQKQEELDKLLEQLKEQKKQNKPAPPPVKPPETTPGDHSHTKTPELPAGGKPVDLVRAAGNLFAAGQLDDAFGIVNVLDLSQLPKDDKAFASYIRAACLRKQGKLTDALAAYKAIADAKDDKFLADTAVVQITAIRSAMELEAQLEQIKSRRKPK